MKDEKRPLWFDKQQDMTSILMAKNLALDINVSYHVTSLNLPLRTSNWVHL